MTIVRILIRSFLHSLHLFQTMTFIPCGMELKMCSNTCHSWLPGLVVREGSQEWLTVEYNVLQHMSLLAARIGSSKRISGVVDCRILSACLPTSLPSASNKQQDNRFTQNPDVHTPKNKCQLQQEDKEEKEKEEEREREKRKRKRRKKKRRKRKTRTRIGEKEGKQSSKGSEKEMCKANCITSKTVCLPHTLYMY